MAKENHLKKLAYELFMSTDMTQKEIAESIRSTEKTLSLWAKDGGWKTIKTAISITEPELIAGYYKIIQKIQGMMLSLDEGNIKEMNTYADAISKIQSKIKALKRNDIDLSLRVMICDEIIEHCRRINPTQLKPLADTLMNFLEEKAKILDSK